MAFQQVDRPRFDAFLANLNAAAESRVVRLRDREGHPVQRMYFRARGRGRVAYQQAPRTSEPMFANSTFPGTTYFIQEE